MPLAGYADSARFDGTQAATVDAASDIDRTVGMAHSEVLRSQPGTERNPPRAFRARGEEARRRYKTNRR